MGWLICLHPIQLDGVLPFYSMLYKKGDHTSTSIHSLVAALQSNFIVGLIKKLPNFGNFPGKFHLVALRICKRGRFQMVLIIQYDYGLINVFLSDKI